jgi:hypothetical protein
MEGTVLHEGLNAAVNLARNYHLGAAVTALKIWPPVVYYKKPKAALSFTGR